MGSPRGACLAELPLKRLSSLSSLCLHPREKLSAWTCHLCPCTCLPPKCVHAYVRTEHEIQHLPSSEKGGTRISGVKSGHVKGQLGWRSIQRSLAVAETGQLGCGPPRVSTAPQGGPPEQASLPDLGLWGLRGLPGDSGSPCLRSAGKGSRPAVSNNATAAWAS